MDQRLTLLNVQQICPTNHLLCCRLQSDSSNIEQTLAKCTLSWACSRSGLASTCWKCRASCHCLWQPRWCLQLSHRFCVCHGETYPQPLASFQAHYLLGNHTSTRGLQRYLLLLPLIDHGVSRLRLRHCWAHHSYLCLHRRSQFLSCHRNASVSPLLSFLGTSSRPSCLKQAKIVLKENWIKLLTLKLDCKANYLWAFLACAE